MSQRINIEIAHRRFEVIAETPEKEALYRKAVKLMNEHIDNYQRKFQSNSMIDIMTFVALGECMNMIRIMDNFEKFEKESNELTKDLESYLGQIKDI